jgi:hypothetical protein
MMVVVVVEEGSLVGLVLRAERDDGAVLEASAFAEPGGGCGFMRCQLSDSDRGGYRGF